MDNAHTKQEVRRFYDRVGWQEVSAGMYQNASYEDLRPVSQAYIRRCHLRVKRYLPPKGRLLLDAGSGPIQYPEYLTYSAGYWRRVCVDISIVALQEARKRIGEHGLYVVADVANLPFVSGAFDGIVSLHTLHHLDIVDQQKSYGEFDRLLQPGSSAVVVNGWGRSALMQAAMPMVRVMERLLHRHAPSTAITPQAAEKEAAPSGTFVQKLDAQALLALLNGRQVEIRCWRSVSVRFLRAMIHPAMLGRLWLGILFWLEDRFPRFFGEKGQYPLLVLRKP